MPERTPNDRPSTTGEEALAGAVNTLVLEEDEGENGCLELLTAPADRRNVIRVGFNDPEGRLQRWKHATGGWEKTAVVSLGEEQRSVAQSAGTTSPGDLRVETVANPTDLTETGVTLTKLFDEFADTGVPTVVCFDSLTALLGYVDLQTAFRFLHVLTDQVRSADGAAHYHLDVDAHDQQTVATLRQLFDTVVTADPEHGLRVE